jgi:hypothetical protein
MSPLYQPFGITSASAVPTKASATPTSLGYIAPKYTTDFAPVRAPAYGPLSEQYFDVNPGMLLPNPSTILDDLRVLKATNPIGYAAVQSMYSAATNREGKRSGLPPQAIDAMLEASAISPGRSISAIGLR